MIRQNATPANRAYGFTIIELLVTILIISLLICLLLPAIHSARESARAAQCLGNLKQIGVALNNYETIFRIFPGATNGLGYSFYVPILPEIELNNTYNSVNFNTFASQNSPWSANFTAYTGRSRLFLCPSSALPTTDETCWNSYGGNTGAAPYTRDYNGFFPLKSNGLGPQDCSDGTSTTICVSEFLFSDGSLSKTNSIIFNLSQVPSTIENFSSKCRQLDPKKTPISYATRGRNWMQGSYYHTLYNHRISINDNSCATNQDPIDSIISAGSNHSGGCFNLFGDGHVTFYSDSLNNKVWQSLGTRNGQEIIN